MRLAVSQSVTGSALKNSVSMLPTRADACAARRLRRGRIASPAASRADSVPAARRADSSRSILQRGDAGGRGQRIAAERAGLKHFARRQHVIHDLGPAAVGADRQPAADDLAQRRQVGLDAQQRLRPAVGHAEAGHHFVEDQQRAVLAASARAGACRNSAVGTTQPMLPTTGSKITPAIRGPCSANAASSAGDVVVLQHERVLASCRR